MENDSTHTHPNENAQSGYAQAARPEATYPPTSPPPPPPRRKGRPILTCLVVVIILGCFGGFFLLLGLAVLTAAGRRPMPVMHTGNSIGVVRIEGIIQDTKHPLEAIKRYLDSDNMKAVIVRIDSPGGTVGASQELYDGIERLRDDGKKVVVSFGDVAASGGYYVASAADEIVTNPGALTGSIGVIFTVVNLQGTAQKLGIDQSVVKSGKYKDIGSAMRDMTPEERALLQGVIDDTYEQFVEHVLKHRSDDLREALDQGDEATLALLEELDLGPDATAEDLLRAVADGRILSGRQAVALGLADQTGSFADAVDRAAQLAGIREPKLHEYEPRQTFSDLFEATARGILRSESLPKPGISLHYRSGL